MGDVQMATEYRTAVRALSLWRSLCFEWSPEEIAKLVDRPLAWVEYVIHADTVDGDELLYFAEGGQ